MPFIIVIQSALRPISITMGNPRSLLLKLVRLWGLINPPLMTLRAFPEALALLTGNFHEKCCFACTVNAKWDMRLDFILIKQK